MTYIARRAVGDSGLDDMLKVLGPFSAVKPEPSDNVDQFAGGGTTTSSADFTTVGSVCKPMNFPALRVVQEFQRQLNRVAQAKGFGKITADGSVGPATLALFRRVQAASAGTVMGDPSDCMGVAPDADVLGVQVRAMADTLGMPATVSGPVSVSIPTIKTKSGKEIVAPDSGLLASLAALSDIEKIALLGVAGGIGYLLMQKRKRGGK